MNLLQIPDIVWTRLWEKFPFIVILIIVIVATVVIVRKIDKFLYKKIEPMQKQIDEHNESIKKFDSHSDCIAHKESLKKIYDMLGNISLTLAAKFPESVDKLSMAHSPRQLTELGKKLYLESGAENMLAQNMAFFISAINKEEIKTALDVENKSFNILLSSSNEDMFNDVKTWIYNHPVFESVNVTLNDICFVAGLELRNEYLKQHPEVEQNL